MDCTAVQSASRSGYNLMPTRCLGRSRWRRRTAPLLRWSRLSYQMHSAPPRGWVGCSMRDMAPGRKHRCLVSLSAHLCSIPSPKYRTLYSPYTGSPSTQPSKKTNSCLPGRLALILASWNSSILLDPPIPWRQRKRILSLSRYWDGSGMRRWWAVLTAAVRSGLNRVIPTHACCTTFTDQV